MAIKKILVTDKDTLNELYDDSALTLEGLAEDSIPEFVSWIEEHTLLKNENVYIIKGGIMNMAYNLTGDNAYANDLTIVAVKLSDMEDVGKIIMPRFNIGGRWFDDIVDNNMADYRRFTKTDWECYFGAEAFSDGSNPFIYERPFESNKGTALCIIVDRNGIQIQLFDVTSSEDNVWIKDIRFTSLRAEGYLRKLIEYTNKYDYAPDLSYELDHPTDGITQGFEFC